MCSYNGAKYIEEQIRSILNQTVPVNEIVLCDDGSEDRTTQIVENIALTSDIPIVVLKNEQRLGVCMNFFKALKSCHGDVIFLSDQDDIWVSNKVERIVKWFSEHPLKNAVFTNAFLSDSSGTPIGGHTLFESVYFTAKAKKAFDEGFALELFLNFNRATGATMAIRKCLVPIVTKLHPCAGNVYHDAIISMAAIGSSSLGYCDECLINYRLHSGQSAGMNVLNGPKEAEHYLSPFYSHLDLGQYALGLQSRVELARFRQKTVYSRNGMIQIIGSAIDYYRYYRSKCLFALLYDIAVNVKYLLLGRR